MQCINVQCFNSLVSYDIQKHKLLRQSPTKHFLKPPNYMQHLVTQKI